MYTLYLICATAGGTILVVQFLLALIGFTGSEGADLDLDADLPETDVSGGEYETDSGEGSSAHESVALFKYLSLRTIVAFFSFFGLTGLLGLSRDWGAPFTLGAAFVAGASAFYIVGRVWRLLFKLESSGNLELRNAVGHKARVYLTIPEGVGSRGKVHIELQGRTVELDANNAGREGLPVGAIVRVVALDGPDCVRVERAD